MQPQIQRAYAGVGSRKTPPEILAFMDEIGRYLAGDGWTLRTGNCRGADQAFQAGANSVAPARVELFLPWPDYERENIATGNVFRTPGEQAFAIAGRHHPAWARCNPGVRSMHARNVEIILGPDLARPVEFLICWTSGGREVGGTAQALRIARGYDIPVYNMAAPIGLAFAEKLTGKQVYKQALFDF